MIKAKAVLVIWVTLATCAVGWDTVNDYFGVYIQEENVVCTNCANSALTIPLVGPVIVNNIPQDKNLHNGIWGRGSHVSVATFHANYYNSPTDYRYDSWIDKIECGGSYNCDPAPGAYKVYGLFKNYHTNMISPPAGYGTNWNWPWPVTFFDAIPEGSTHTWACTSGHMTCEKVYYGRTINEYLYDYGRPYDVTDAMNLSCQNQGSQCTYDANNQWWGDPAPGVPKWLWMFNCCCILTPTGSCTAVTMRDGTAREILYPTWLNNGTSPRK